MYTASCLCGGIQLNIHQEIDRIYICHCQQCQKAQGAAFVAISVIETQHIEYVKGMELLAEYSATQGKKRVFCRLCASPIFSARDDLPHVVRLRVGIINQPLSATVYSHAFTRSKTGWLNLADDKSLQFEAHAISL